jgi:hypothetical protein
MTTHAPKSGKSTLAMTVNNTGFLVDRLGEDCHPLQHLRELTTNSIEAILQTPEKAGEIVWDADWVTYDLESVYKLSITDTGVGMTGTEMEKYINQLSSSGSEQSLSANYGVGGKIATATKNHAGVIYLSWKNSKSAVVHLWRDAETSQYGLKRFDTGDGETAYHYSVEDAVKPSLITSHGTKVVLLGNSNDEDTMKAPPDTPSPSRWISKYLNSRYFRFPAKIAIKVREGWEYPREDKDRNLLRGIVGQEKYLNEHAESSGKVDLTGAKAHWWILKDEPAIANNSGFIESAGHVAALYKDELYELTSGRGGYTTLQTFGVIFGYRQVVIYVEPDQKSGQLTTNTARTALLLNRQRLPWSDWATEFREKMPDEIENLIATKAAGASGADHSKSIKERLQQIIELFKLSRYKPVKDGPFRVSPGTSSGGRSSIAVDPKIPSGGGSGGVAGGGTGSSTGGVYAAFQTDSGEPAKQVKGEAFPEVVWIRVKDGTRTAGDLEDRAARYLSDQNTLLVNGDFRVFSDMVNKFVGDLGNKESLRPSVQDAVEQWFEQSLVETVIGIQALKNAPEWNPQDVGNALSEEALTAAVMPRYHVHSAVKRHLGSKLGKMN